MSIGTSDGDVKLVVLSVAGNEGARTYDGIDHCAERACEEIDAEIETIESQGIGKVTRFSIIGYSLGGLIARYTIGLLRSRSPSFFDVRRPVNFATIASPAIGMPRYRGVFPAFIHFAGARLLSRTGAQLYARDKFSKGKPLLEVMAEPGSSFFEALKNFERVEVYANALQDRTVPFPTGGIAAHDFFDEARRKSREARDSLKLLRDNEEGEKLDMREGGMEITLDDRYPSVILSIKEIEPATPHWDPAHSKDKKRLALKLPIFLRPSTFHFYPPWARYMVVCFLPVYLPTLLIVATAVFSIQSTKSRSRIRALRQKTGLTDRNARLERVGIRDRISSAVEDAELMMDNAGTQTSTPRKGSPEPSPPADPEDPLLTPAQLRMIEHLNSIPQLRKHYAYFPEAMNAHAVIICRDPARFPLHEQGREVLRHWADGFRL